jgi:hypothetical protein
MALLLLSGVAVAQPAANFAQTMAAAKSPPAVLDFVARALVPAASTLVSTLGALSTRLVVATWGRVGQAVPPAPPLRLTPVATDALTVASGVELVVANVPHLGVESRPLWIRTSLVP